MTCFRISCISPWLFICIFSARLQSRRRRESHLEEEIVQTFSRKRKAEEVRSVIILRGSIQILIHPMLLLNHLILIDNETSDTHIEVLHLLLNTTHNNIMASNHYKMLVYIIQKINHFDVFQELVRTDEVQKRRRQFQQEVKYLVFLVLLYILPFTLSWL